MRANWVSQIRRTEAVSVRKPRVTPWAGAAGEGGKRVAEAGEELGQVVGGVVAGGDGQEGKHRRAGFVPERGRGAGEAAARATVARMAAAVSAQAARRPRVLGRMTAERPGNSSGLMPRRVSHQKVRCRPSKVTVARTRVTKAAR